MASGGVSSKRAERPLRDPDAATRLPTISWVDLVTFLTVDAAPVGLPCPGGGEAALMVSGELLGMLSACLSSGSPWPRALRNQPLTRDWTGDESGVGDSEGNDVRLLSSAAGEGVRPREVLEARLSGRTRAGPRLLLLEACEACEFCDEVRTRSTAPNVSDAAMAVGVGSGGGRGHSATRVRVEDSTRLSTAAMALLLLLSACCGVVELCVGGLIVVHVERRASWAGQSPTVAGPVVGLPKKGGLVQEQLLGADKQRASGVQH